MRCSNGCAARRWRRVPSVAPAQPAAAIHQTFASQVIIYQTDGDGRWGRGEAMLDLDQAIFQVFDPAQNPQAQNIKLCSEYLNCLSHWYTYKF
jgi:hypothetical protein